MEQYLEMFLDESKEHLQNMNDGLLQLEEDPQNETAMEEIFRAAHTLKGMAASMGYSSLADLTHETENVLDAIRHESLEANRQMIDLLFLAATRLEEMIQDIENGGEGKRDVRDIVHRLQQVFHQPQSADDVAQTDSGSTVLTLDDYEKNVLAEATEDGQRVFQIDISLDEKCVLKAARIYMIFTALEKRGEVIKAVPSVEELEEEAFDREFSLLFLTQETKETLEEDVMGISEVERVRVSRYSMEQEDQRKKTADGKEKESPRKVAATLRVQIEKLDQIMNLFEEMVIEKGKLTEVSRQLGHPDLQEAVEAISRVTSDLQERMLKLRMVPIDHVFRRFPKMVRDLARELGKEVHFVVEGGETELDRTVVDQIGDPLVHLLRNSLDHGIETKDVRQKRGKPAKGHVTLRAYYSGNRVLIEIEDDGGGIDERRVREKAVKNGILTEAESLRLSQKEIFQLLFSSGFSTAEKISDISGRGVGLDVVKNKIESLGGTVTVESNPGEGTLFIISLPLTLSVIQAMLVHVGKETYAIPVSGIEEMVDAHREKFLTIHRQPWMRRRERLVPVIDLRDVFYCQERSENSSGAAVIVQKSGQKVALLVDRLLGQHEIVLKPLGRYLRNIFAISGATILGDGSIALVIDYQSLVGSATKNENQTAGGYDDE